MSFPTRRSKYRAKPTVVDGIRFASKKESERYLILKFLEREGTIANLELQVRFPLIINDTLVTTYVADFRYVENGQLIVEDVKGFKTPEYKLKKKLLFALSGIQIKET